VKDAAEILKVIAGKCELDPATQKIPFDVVPDYPSSCKANGLHGVRIGCPVIRGARDPPPEELSDYISAAFDAALAVIQSSGTTVKAGQFVTNFNDFYESKAPDIVKAWDFQQMIASYFGSLEMNPSGLRDAGDLLKWTVEDPREAHGERSVRGLATASLLQNVPVWDPRLLETVAEMDLLNEGNVSATLAFHDIDVLMLPTCVAPGIPSLGGYPMISVPLTFYPENTEPRMIGTVRTNGTGTSALAARTDVTRLDSSTETRANVPEASSRNSDAYLEASKVKLNARGDMVDRAANIP